MHKYLIDVDDLSPAMAPEILPNFFYLRWYFPKEERMMQHNNGKYFPQLRNHVYQSSRRTKQHYVNGTCTQRTNTCNPTRKRGCQSLLGIEIDKIVCDLINRSNKNTK